MIKYWAKISWFFTAAWMGVIFSFSSYPAKESQVMSTGLTISLVRFLYNTLLGPIEEARLYYIADLADNFVRKFAHFTEYFILGLLVVVSFHLSGLRGGKKYRTSFLFCVLYAMSDEIHQIFVPGRACRFGDVLIDSMGVALSLFLFHFFFWVQKRWKWKKS